MNNSYELRSDSLFVRFEFLAPDDTREAILLPNNSTGITITSSTCWLDSLALTGEMQLSYTTGAHGTQTIQWPRANGRPEVTSDSRIDVILRESQSPAGWTIIATPALARAHVTVAATKSK